MNPTIYLDHNATTPPHPEVCEAMARALRDWPANPASQHEPGRRARAAVEQARERIGELLGARVGGLRDDQIIFTSGGTEANNLALRGLAQPHHRIVVSRIEHPSIGEAAKAMASEGWDIGYLSVNERGTVESAELANWLDGRTGLVSVMLGNNETGVLQPVVEIVAIAREHRIAVHTDAVQVAGKLPIDFHALGVTAMTIAAHKFHGPVGIGALIARHGATIRPIHFGGKQQGGVRPGTESVALVVGMRVALEQWDAEQAGRLVRMQHLRDRFERLLARELTNIVVVGQGSARLPHTSNVAFPGCDRQALWMALDVQKVACSTGSACASGSSEPSPVLLAMNVPPEVVESSLRFSIGAFTTEAEIDEGVRRIVTVVRRARPAGPA